MSTINGELRGLDLYLFHSLHIAADITTTSGSPDQLVIGLAIGIPCGLIILLLVVLICVVVCITMCNSR